MSQRISINEECQVFDPEELGATVIFRHQCHVLTQILCSESDTRAKSFSASQYTSYGLILFWGSASHMLRFVSNENGF